MSYPYSYLGPNHQRRHQFQPITPAPFSSKCECHCHDREQKARPQPLSASFYPPALERRNLVIHERMRTYSSPPPQSYQGDQPHPKRGLGGSLNPRAQAFFVSSLAPHRPRSGSGTLIPLVHLSHRRRPRQYRRGQCSQQSSATISQSPSRSEARLPSSYGPTPSRGWVITHPDRLLRRYSSAIPITERPGTRCQFNNIVYRPHPSCVYH
jgi:hypothetical protein